MQMLVLSIAIFCVLSVRLLRTARAVFEFRDNRAIDEIAIIPFFRVWKSRCRSMKKTYTRLAED